MTAHSHIIGENNQPAQIAFSLTDPWSAGLTDVCSATIAQFTGFNAGCQVTEAGLDASQNVERGTRPPTFCDPVSRSFVQSVTDEWTAELSVLMDEDQAQGMAAFLLENSGKTAWLFTSTGPGGTPPITVSTVRLAPARLLGAIGEERVVTVSLAIDGKPAVCAGNATTHRAINNPPDPNDVTATNLPNAATFADLAALKADGAVGDGAYSGPAFTSGQYVTLGDASKAHYTASAWAAGATS